MNLFRRELEAGFLLSFKEWFSLTCQFSICDQAGCDQLDGALRGTGILDGGD